MPKLKKSQETIEFRHQYIKPEITVAEARIILCKYGAQYTDQEIKEIIILMQNLVEIDYTSVKRKQAERGR